MNEENLAKAEETCNNVYHDKDKDEDGLCNFCRGTYKALLQQQLAHQAEIARIREAIADKFKCDCKEFQDWCEDCVHRTSALAAFDSAVNQEST